jgi:membrane-bound lytic murein transglycosylase D
MALGALLVLARASGALAAPVDEFPLPAELAPAVRFWVDVFTRYSQQDVVIHDRLEPWRVYAVMQASGPEEATRGRVRAWVDHLVLTTTLRPDPRWLRLGEPAPQCEFPATPERIRLQRGMREAFARGLVGERLYRSVVRRALARAGLPAALGALPLIESSYRPDAISRAGAVGLWQFMPATAQRYLRVASAVDERRNPVRASEAAARHLRALRTELPNWPLALTAYNHGLTGVERARHALGSDDLGVLVTRYRGPGFGFASRNFYAEFLAARHVLHHVGTYFPELAPERLVEYRVKRGDSLYAVARRHGVTVPALLTANRLHSSKLQPGQVLVIRL